MTAITSPMLLMLAALASLLLAGTPLGTRAWQRLTDQPAWRWLDAVVAGSKLPVPVPIVAAAALGLGLLAARLLWNFSPPLALMAGIVAAASPLLLIALRAGSKQESTGRAAIAAGRAISAHLRAGENLYRSIEGTAAAGDGPVERALKRAGERFRLDLPLARALSGQTAIVRNPQLALMLGVLSQVATHGSVGETAASVVDGLCDELEQSLRARVDLRERTRGVAVQLYVVAGAIPAISLWLAQTSPHGQSVFDLDVGRTVLLPIGLALEFLGIVLFWRWTRPSE